MRKAEETALRLKKVLLQDKLNVNVEFMQVLESDLYNLLENYLALKQGSLRIKMDLTDSGDYRIKITADCDRVKNIGIVKKV